MSKTTQKNCKRCGEGFTDYPNYPMDYCALCDIHAQTGVIGYGLRPALPGYKPEKRR